MDRNATMQIVIIVVDTSLSARRAWIEIFSLNINGPLKAVALRKESVDRNQAEDISARREASRSPQGERG